MGEPKALFKDYKDNRRDYLYSNTKIAKKGALGTLYLGGNSNNKKTYTLTLAGRYTS